MNLIFCILALVVLCSPSASAAQASNQEPQPGEPAASQIQSAGPAIDVSHCGAIAARDSRITPLSAICEFALTFRKKLPDFICEQTITNTGTLPETVLKEEVTFAQGNERYSNKTVNGKPAGADVRSNAGSLRFLSAGELGSDLVNLFKPPVATEFRFRKHANLRKVPSEVYDLHLAAEKNNFWSIRDSQGMTAHPELKGELWLERDTGRIQRLQWRTRPLPEDFLVDSVNVTIDYNQIPIADVGVFLLPTVSETTTCFRVPLSSVIYCSKNVLVFHDCRKFAAKTRIRLEGP